MAAAGSGRESRSDSFQPPLVLRLAAFLSFAASVAPWLLVDRQTGIFIGLWVPPILSLAALLSLARVKP